MSKRRHKRRHRDEDRVSGKTSAEQARDVTAMNESLTRPLTPQAVFHLQQQYGNSYVQRVLLDRQREEAEIRQEKEQEAAKASGRVAYRTAYHTITTGQFNRQGDLLLDLARVIHMGRYGEASQAFRNQIAGWQGAGQVEMDVLTFKADNLKMATDGRMRLPLGQEFLRQLAASHNPESREKLADLDFNKEFNVRLKASLHYRSQDPSLQDSGVPQADKLLGQQNHHGFFLKIEIESLYVIRVDQQPEEKRLCGELLLQGMITT